MYVQIFTIVQIFWPFPLPMVPSTPSPIDSLVVFVVFLFIYHLPNVIITSIPLFHQSTLLIQFSFLFGMLSVIILSYCSCCWCCFLTCTCCFLSLAGV